MLVMDEICLTIDNCILSLAQQNATIVPANSSIDMV